METDDYSIVDFGKTNNEVIAADMKNNYYDELVIEMIASYGLPVGKEIFGTCLWIGRFVQIACDRNVFPNLLYRSEVKLNLCRSLKAKDSNVIQALKDRFGDKGTIKNKGWFYGFSKDVWQAYAIAVTWTDERKLKGWGK
jgi:hypothetical protein